MDIDSILSIKPKLSEGEFVTPQPSLDEMIREHYRRLDVTGDGQILADRHIAVLKDMAASAPSRAAEADAPRAEEPAAEPVRPNGPDGGTTRDPFAGIAALDIGLSIGGVDVAGGLRHAAKNGDVAPLVAGFAGLLLGAMAGRPKGEAER